MGSWRGLAPCLLVLVVLCSGSARAFDPDLCFSPEIVRVMGISNFNPFPPKPAEQWSHFTSRCQRFTPQGHVGTVVGSHHISPPAPFLVYGAAQLSWESGTSLLSVQEFYPFRRYVVSSVRPSSYLSSPVMAVVVVVVALFLT